MIITPQVCCVILTACVMSLYYPGQKLYTTSDTIFSKILFSLMLACIFDSALSYLHMIPFLMQDSSALAFCLQLCNKMRISCVVALIINIYEYDLIGIRERTIKHKLIAIIFNVLPLLTPDIVYEHHIYKGLYYWITTAIVILFVSILIYMIRHNIDIINKTKIKITFGFLGAWVFAELFNAITGIRDLICVTGVIGVMFLFYYVENPKSKLDSETGMYTLYFMKEYLNSIIYLKKPVYIGVLYIKSGSFDFDLLYSLFDRDVYYFKDTDELIYIASRDNAKIEHILTEYRTHEISLTLIYTYDLRIPFENFRMYIQRYALNFNDKIMHYISAENVLRLDEDEKIRMEIIHALVEDRIITYIQPIYSLREDKFVSGECLCRMQRKNGEIVSPAVFIPVAEQTGLVTNIESVMFRNLCKCLSDERVKASSIRYLDVNLSIKKGEQNSLVEEYNKILSEYDIDAGKINLEITETDSVNEKLSILNNMNTMKSQGFRFALDDFGTGESNLGYIIDMPVSVIKFDKEITHKAMQDQKAWLVVKNVIDMAHDLNIEVVVEGVESEDQLNSCKRLNADYIQGYYFSKPLPVEEFIRFCQEYP